MTVAVAAITEADVDASIERVIRHAESIWDEWAWQVENEVWKIGNRWDSWDEMRRAVYSNLTSITAPRKERPELVARFRSAGLTQKETAETLGVSKMTVRRHDPDPAPSVQKNTSEPDVIDAEIVEGEEDRRANKVLALINDLRGPWAKGLCGSATKMTKREREIVIEVLRDVLNRLEDMSNE